MDKKTELLSPNKKAMYKSMNNMGKISHLTNPYGIRDISTNVRKFIKPYERYL